MIRVLLKPLQVAVVFCMFVAVMARADGADPHQLVQQVTDKLVSAAQAHNDGGDQASFDGQVMAALEPVVAFDYIARVVMGDYYAEASGEQRRAFAEKFQADLVSTYAKGIATYADSNIKLMAPAKPIGDARRATVEQEVSHEGSSHKLSYTMGKNRDGEWKLLNVVLNGINLGRSFSSQFKQLANKYQGDVDQVISHWDAAED
ncbi:MlaC/ttg2D family ABC transporter substrate-binding protein [Gilvimarinus polysaccharolyticus]|uniref:MlaC/ttg2D family ABC transporter substrate-binding protein n=1 Tax=Gilvimarinus polysaccharolyticus TaxID=863921 RepID=UPI00067371E1|nr:ABC transporter substrate-binding protein [Gilvimarinus polysaccharolyticus]